MLCDSRTVLFIIAKFSHSIEFARQSLDLRYMELLLSQSESIIFKMQTDIKLAKSDQDKPFERYFDAQAKQC